MTKLAAPPVVSASSTKRHELAEKISNLVVAVLDDGPLERSRSFLPLMSDPKRLIAPGETSMFSGRPQFPFRGDRLAVWSVVAPSFLIEGLRVGNCAQGVSYGDVPADAFATRLDLLPLLDQQLDRDGFVQVRVSRKAEECFGQLLAFPCARPGIDVYITVTNVSQQPLRFVAVILGDIEHGTSRFG